MSTKRELRSLMLRSRSSLSLERQLEARDAFLELAKRLFCGNSLVLSYAAFRSELDSSPVNSWLAAQGRLALPRVDGDVLRVYRVSDTTSQLSPSKWGIPEPCQAPELHPDQIELAFVPGLAFDRDRQRLGYGKGYFDRFLQQANACTAYGVGFHEQLIEGCLPREKHDVALHDILLF